MLRQKSLLSTTTLSSMKKIKPAPATMSTTFFLKWQIFLFGLFYIIMQCDARAVNVSNTWTMPQEGLSVFYRFFRDRISWFEADAVCQFHHANLVTVDNSFQFDATRDLLRELDVNDIVWIGLMRPQSSDRFMWSNSRPLVADTGYWAESLPLMDAPLCAVIDPIRDYRWHALRCGGPETASFLCEMPVPNWADACILKDMPNLTMQYMADTASIELIRNCQEEGLLRTSCKGKLDRERAVQDLICPRERLEAQRINDITNSHFKSLQIINSIPTDNNENNDIELLPIEQNYAPAQAYPEELQTEKNTVQKLIEQFNVDELMQADEPTTDADSVSTFYKIPGLIPKPVKKSAKKELEYPKKDVGKSKSTVATTQVPFKDIKKYEAYILDDMMLGDQPQAEHEISEQILNEDVSNEILEPLPHIKKTNIHHKEDMSKMEKEAIAIKESMQKSREMEASKMRATTAGPVTAATSSTAATVIEKNSMAATTTAAVPLAKSSTIISSTDVGTTAAPAIAMDDTTTNSGHHSEHAHNVELITLHADTTTTVATIGHPMHPQQPRSNAHNEDSQNHQHIKESTDNSHFIPPMLLVKSHYVPHGHNAEHNNNNGEHKHNVEHDNLETIATATATTTAIQEEHSTSRKQNAMMEETTENALTTAVAGIAATTTATTMPKMMTTSKDVNAEQTAEKSLNTKHQQEEEQQQHKSLVTQDQQLLEQLFKETATEKDIMQTQTSTTQAEQLREQKKLIPATTIKTESDTTLATTTSTFAAAAVKEKQAAEFETTSSSSLMQTSTIKTAVEGEKMLLLSNANDDELQTTLKQKQLPAHETTTIAAASDAQEEDKRETRDLEDTTLRAEAEAAAPTQPKFSTTAVNKHLKLDNEKDISKADKTTATTQRTTFEQGTTISQPLTTTLSGKKEEQLIEQQQQQSVDLQKLKEAKEIETTTTIIEQHQETTHAAATQTPQLEYSSDQRQGQDETSEKIKRINLLTKVSTTTTTTAKPIITTATAEETARTTTATLMPSAAINLKQDEQKQQTTIKQVEIQANLEAEADNEQETIGKTTEEAQHTFPITKTPEATTLLPTTIKAGTEQLATIRPTTGNSINISTQVKHAISTAITTADASTTLQSSFSSTTTSAPTEATSTPTTPITSTTPTSTTTPRPPETTTRNFLKVTTEEPFKPNRHRSLTKPESVSYIKKILG